MLTCLSHPKWLACVVALLTVMACKDDSPDPAESDGGDEVSADESTEGDGELVEAVDAGEDEPGYDCNVNWVNEECNGESGIECDGNWSNKCSPSCAPCDCCSPQGGEFVCIPRGEGGSCPAADLWMDTERIVDDYTVMWRYITADSCVVSEGCVEDYGWRRLLYFDAWTPNTGDADMYLGPPWESAGHFDWSACHQHFHFESYARWELRHDDGSVAAAGHKQAFCLLDYYKYPGEDFDGAHYQCENQGIQRGWQDVYDAGLDCQWIDVTDIEPGEYTLWAELNFDNQLLESNYDNNTSEVLVTIGPDDPLASVTEPCNAGSPYGPERECGLVNAGEFACTPGETVTAGCSDLCGLGTCSGDTFMRVCEAGVGDACGLRQAIGDNDDSGCVGSYCGWGGDCCSRVELSCPESGGVTVFWGSWYYEDAAETRCEVQVEIDD